MTYHGHMVAALTGAIIVTDRDLKVVDYQLFPGEWMENSVAVAAFLWQWRARGERDLSGARPYFTGFDQQRIPGGDYAQTAFGHTKIRVVAAGEPICGVLGHRGCG